MLFLIPLNQSVEANTFPQFLYSQIVNYLLNIIISYFYLGNVERTPLLAVHIDDGVAQVRRYNSLRRRS